MVEGGGAIWLAGLGLGGVGNRDHSRERKGTYEHTERVGKAGWGT